MLLFICIKSCSLCPYMYLQFRERTSLAPTHVLGDTRIYRCVTRATQFSRRIKLCLRFSMIAIELEVDETCNHRPFTVFAVFQAYRRKLTSKPTRGMNILRKKERLHFIYPFTSPVSKSRELIPFQIVDELEISSMQNEQTIQILL